MRKSRKLRGNAGIAAALGAVNVPFALILYWAREVGRDDFNRNHKIQDFLLNFVFILIPARKGCRAEFNRK